MVEVDAPRFEGFRRTPTGKVRRRVCCRHCDVVFEHPSHQFCSRRCLRAAKAARRVTRATKRHPRSVLIPALIAGHGCIDDGIGLC